MLAPLMLYIHARARRLILRKWHVFASFLLAPLARLRCLGGDAVPGPGGHVACACFLPTCTACSGGGTVPPSSQALLKRQWNNWKGRAASDSTLRLVASVHDELQTMLGASVEEQILSRGQGWSSVSSGDASKGSRLEKIVARLCRCGITTVMQARRLDGRYEKPRQRGVKRAVADSESDDSSNAGTEDEVADLWPDVSQGLEQASLQPTPKMQEVGGVRGRYLPQALLQPQEHAIAITIGRIVIWGECHPAANSGGLDGTDVVGKCCTWGEIPWKVVCFHVHVFGISNVPKDDVFSL